VTSASFFVKSTSACILPQPPSVKNSSSIDGNSSNSIPNLTRFPENSLPACFPASSQTVTAPDPKILSVPLTKSLNVEAPIKIQSSSAIRISPLSKSYYALLRREFVGPFDPLLFNTVTSTIVQLQFAFTRKLTQFREKYN